MERKEREKEQRRQDIVRAAEAIFSTRGYETATMEDIAEKAELSKGTLYLYFKSKVEIHWAVMQKGMVILSEMLDGCVSAANSGLENLVEAGRAFYLFSEDYPDHFSSILFFEGKDIEKLNLGEGQFAEWFHHSPIKQLYKLVESGMRDGSVRCDLPVPAMANALWAQTLGVLQVIRNKVELLELLGIPPADLIQCHFDLLLDGVKVKQPDS